MEKVFGTIFPTTFGHFVSLCHILVILTIFQTFRLLIYLMLCLTSDLFFLILIYFFIWLGWVLVAAPGFFLVAASTSLPTEIKCCWSGKMPPGLSRRSASLRLLDQLLEEKAEMMFILVNVFKLVLDIILLHTL